jgi:uncharacterized protein YciI
VARIVVSILVCLLAAACASNDIHSDPLACTLVYLKNGPRHDKLSPEEQGKLFTGHFANMERLARAGDLLVAGPFMQPKRDPELAGIFLLDTGARGRATQLAETDPAFRAGVFVLEYHEFSTTAPLHVFHTAEMARLDQAERDGQKPEPGADCRNYVLLTADDGARAQAELAGRPGVLLLGRLDGTRAFALLDANNLAAAKEVLGTAADRLGTYVCDPWFASKGLAQLPALARTGR